MISARFKLCVCVYMYVCYEARGQPWYEVVGAI